MKLRSSRWSSQTSQNFSPSAASTPSERSEQRPHARTHARARHACGHPIGSGVRVLPDQISLRRGGKKTRIDLTFQQDEYRTGSLIRIRLRKRDIGLGSISYLRTCMFHKNFNITTPQVLFPRKSQAEFLVGSFLMKEGGVLYDSINSIWVVG